MCCFSILAKRLTELKTTQLTVVIVWICYDSWESSVFGYLYFMPSHCTNRLAIFNEEIKLSLTQSLGIKRSYERTRDHNGISISPQELTIKYISSINTPASHCVVIIVVVVIDKYFLLSSNRNLITEHNITSIQIECLLIHCINKVILMKWRKLDVCVFCLCSSLLHIASNFRRNENENENDHK